MQKLDFVDQLKSRLTYCPDSGKFFWKSNKCHPRLVGLEAGSIRSSRAHNRVYIKLNSKSYPRARLAFIFMTGKIPHIVDHINGNTMDDRWKNLREATSSQNCWNIGGFKKRSNTPIGVRRLSGGKFQARIAVYGKTIIIGSFETEESAFAAYISKKKSLHGDFYGRLDVKN